MIKLQQNKRVIFLSVSMLIMLVGTSCSAIRDWQCRNLPQPKDGIVQNHHTPSDTISLRNAQETFVLGLSMYFSNRGGQDIPKIKIDKSSESERLKQIVRELIKSGIAESPKNKSDNLFVLKEHYQIMPNGNKKWIIRVYDFRTQRTVYQREFLLR